MKILGVEFAPLALPYARRLQTLSVLIWVTLFLLTPFLGGALLIALLFSPFHFFGVFYIGWYFYDRRTQYSGGRRKNWVRNCILWKYMRDYFPISLVKTGDLDPEKNYIIGYHPHGIFSAGAFINFATEATGWSKNFPGVTPHLLTLDGHFRFPFHREYIMSAGICAVSRESCDYILSKKGKGNAICIVIGGAAESLDARPGLVRLTLKRRKGFVRMALKHGASLIPVFSFGENDLFTQVANNPGSRLRRCQDWFTRIAGFAPPIIFGRGIFQYTFGYLPFRKPIHTVVGEPIPVELDCNPSEELVNKLHDKYMKSLQELFDEYKVKYGSPYKDMEMVFA